MDTDAKQKLQRRCLHAVDNVDLYDYVDRQIYRIENNTLDRDNIRYIFVKNIIRNLANCMTIKIFEFIMAYLIYKYMGIKL